MIDKNGQPYTPMSAAEMQVHRSRPYPEAFTRLSQSLAQHAAQRATEPARAHKVHPEDTRAAPEPMAKAIARAVKTTRKVRRG